MPRKLRCISLVLVVALSASLICPAVQAAPLAPQSWKADFSSAGFLTAAWSWFAAKVNGLGNMVSVNLHQDGAGLRKDQGGGDPNNGAANTTTRNYVVVGTGSSFVVVQP
jgi:hypothetical protein